MAAALPFALGGLVGGVASLLTKKKPAEAAATPAPQVMPLPDDEAIKAAKRRSISMQLNRGGRSSTILTDNSDTLGG